MSKNKKNQKVKELQKVRELQYVEAVELLRSVYGYALLLSYLYTKDDDLARGVVESFEYDSERQKIIAQGIADAQLANKHTYEERRTVLINKLLSVLRNVSLGIQVDAGMDEAIVKCIAMRVLGIEE